MLLQRLWLQDFRSYERLDVTFPAGLTVVAGGNGRGKTNLLEAVGFLGTLSSFRGAPTEALVREGASQAIVRAELERDGRRLLVETELSVTGRTRAMVNRQPLRRARDLLGALRATVFSPDDLELVKGGPAGRRRYLDDLLVALHPRNDELRAEVDRVLRQRNALLRQVGPRLDAETELTLEVWDAKLVRAGEALASARRELVQRLAPVLEAAYERVAEEAPAIGARYEAAWEAEGLAAALVAARKDELRRGLSLVGPHRDELDLTLASMPARTRASQGEQRTLALALRLAAHQAVIDQTGTTPLLLLDDVFSELDPRRSAALLGSLPSGQAIVTTAESLPPGAVAEQLLEIGELVT